MKMADVAQIHRLVGSGEVLKGRFQAHLSWISMHSRDYKGGSGYPREKRFARHTTKSAIKHPPVTASVIASVRQNPCGEG